MAMALNPARWMSLALIASCAKGVMRGFSDAANWRIDVLCIFFGTQIDEGKGEVLLREWGNLEDIQA